MFERTIFFSIIYSNNLEWLYSIVKTHKVKIKSILLMQKILLLPKMSELLMWTWWYSSQTFITSCFITYFKIIKPISSNWVESVNGQYANSLICNRGSNTWAHGLAVMTSPLHGEGRRFKSGWAHSRLSGKRLFFSHKLLDIFTALYRVESWVIQGGFSISGISPILCLFCIHSTDSEAVPMISWSRPYLFHIHIWWLA